MKAKLTAEPWDAVIVGAGPAGSVSAALLAERGWRVLLVERAAWPREKACGGCVNAAAIRMLGEIGLADVLRNGLKLQRMALHMRNRSLDIHLPVGVAVARRELDEQLVDGAVERGAIFVPGAHAALIDDSLESPQGSCRKLILSDKYGSMEVAARVVLACDGQRGGLVSAEPWGEYHRDGVPLLGFSATVSDSGDLPGDAINMFVCGGEYVGLVRLTDDRMHIGAALRAVSCNVNHGPVSVIRHILQSCGYDGLDGLANIRFSGTGPLSGRRPIVAGHRVLVVGDACGYVEPFTGEGIAWAIRGAMEAVAVLPDRLLDWSTAIEAAWQARYESTILRQQRWCRGLRQIIRRPRLAHLCMRAGQYWPAAPTAVARKISVGCA